MSKRAERRYADSEGLRDRSWFQLAKIWGAFTLGTLGWLGTLAAKGSHDWDWMLVSIAASTNFCLIAVVAALRYGRPRKLPPRLLGPPLD
jgi:hypothetical protein